MLGAADQAVPMLLNVFGWAADLSHDHGDVLRRHHLDRVPGAHRKLVRVGFLLRDVHAHLAAHATFEIDFTPLLRALHDAAVDRLELDAIHRADFETRLAAGAIVGVDYRQLLGNFFAWSFFGHE